MYNSNLWIPRRDMKMIHRNSFMASLAVEICANLTLYLSLPTGKHFGDKRHFLSRKQPGGMLTFSTLCHKDTSIQWEYRTPMYCQNCMYVQGKTWAVMSVMHGTNKYEIMLKDTRDSRWMLSFLFSFKCSSDIWLCYDKSLIPNPSKVCKLWGLASFIQEDTFWRSMWP